MADRTELPCSLAKAQLLEEEREENYRTWPDRLSGWGEEGRRPSLSLIIPSPLEGGRKEPVSLQAALESLAISYSPKTRGLHSTALSVDSPAEREELDLIVPASVGEDKEVEDREGEVEECEEREVEEGVKRENVEGQLVEPPAPRYVPTHRKAFSLPRTLEVVDEHGAISPALPNSQVESPRSTLLRYGLSYKPYNFQKDPAGQDTDSMSSISGLTDYSETRDSSSLADSGISSSASSSSLQQGQGQAKRGLQDFLSLGRGLIQRSSLQVVRLMKKEGVPPLSSSRPEPEDGVSSSGLIMEAQSSSGLIMEARPLGLPAKSLEEEAQHQRQHRQLLETVRKRGQVEGRERSRRLAEQRRMEDSAASLTQYWSQTVLPNWAEEAGSPRTRALWWRGLPPPVRGRVWARAHQNRLNLSKQLYTILRTRAQQQLQGQGQEEETLHLIHLDIGRTFPSLGIFQEGGPYHGLLHSLLGAYVCYRPDLGYVQGMSFIAAILLLNLDEADAFIVFANLVNRPCLAAFYRVDTEVMGQYYIAFSSLLSLHLPKLAKHFSRVGLRPELYMLDWVMTLFSKAAPLDLTCRLWDMLIRDGEEFLFRASLGVLAMFQDHLLEEHDFILLAQFLTKLPESVDADSLFSRIEQFEGVELLLS